MLQCRLRHVVVNIEVVAQSRFELGGRTEAALIATHTNMGDRQLGAKCS